MDAEFIRYQFQDGYSGVVTKQKFRIGVRHVQMVYMFFSSIALGLVRGSTGIAVLAMNDKTNNSNYIQIHNWDKKVQGTILASFFFGYALMIIPADLYFRKVNGKFALTIMLLVNGALCAAMPVIANKGGWVAVSNAQLFMGMTQGCISPVFDTLLGRWLPPSEMNLFSSLVFGGLQLGTIIALPASGLISEHARGWEMIYYSLAIATLSMAVIIATLTANSLEDHEAVGDGEKEYVSEALSLYRKKSLPKPWRKILRSSKYWALCSAHAASNAIFVFYLVDVPAYLKTFQMSLKIISVYTMMPFISMWLMYMATGPTIDWISRLGYVNYLSNITYFRKFINALGTFGIVAGLTILGNLTTQLSDFAVVMLTAVLGSLGFQFSGFLSNHKDMTENHAGTLMMMTSSVASVFGAGVPFLSGLVINDDPADHTRWRAILLSLASFYALCNIVYTAFGSNERQEWDHTTNREKIGHYNAVIDGNQVQLEEFTHTKLIQERRDNDSAF